MAVTAGIVVNPKKVDWDTSDKIAEAVGAAAGRCAANVGRAFLYSLHLLPADAKYIQGLWVLEGQCDGHVWIETSLSIIDPTLAILDWHSTHPLSFKHSIPALIWIPEQVRLHYCGVSIEARQRLDLILNSGDQRVESIRARFDPP